MAKSLGSETKDNYIQISASVRDIGEDLLTSLSFNFLIYKMPIIVTFAFASDAKSPVGCAGSRQTFLWVPSLYKQLESPQIVMPAPFWWPILTLACKIKIILGSRKDLLTRLPFQR